MLEGELLRLLSEPAVQVQGIQSSSVSGPRGPQTELPRKKGINMTAGTTYPTRLYLLQLSTSTVPLPGGRTLEMSCAAYLVETGDGKHILIDTGLPHDFPK